jgi:predicted nuclease with RNAse H fold
MADVVGIHLLQPLELVASRRRSAVARVDDGGRLVGLELAGADEEILALVPPETAAVAVDAPLEVPNEAGRRDVERVLEWCDVAAFPVSRRRLRQVHGGARGVSLAPALGAPGRIVLEALPDQVLRQIAWEREHPAGTPAIDLGDYREAWVVLRAPSYRPKGAGRARPPGIVPAWRLLGEVLDLAGWLPAPEPDDWGALDDAARLDALCCAYAARRATDAGGAGAALVGAPGLGQVTLVADANLRERLAITLDRLRGEGTVAI